MAANLNNTKNIIYGFYTPRRLLNLHARMRFFKESSQPNEIRPQSYREFEIPEDQKNATLYYDCLWSDSLHEESTYHSQYIAKLPNDSLYLYKYVFHVPNHLNREYGIALTDWELFLVVDISVLPVLRLRVQCAPECYNVTRYYVKIYRRLEQEDGDSLANSYAVRAPPNTTEDMFFNISYDTAFMRGIYRFTVRTLHPECAGSNKCISESPPVGIGNYLNRKSQ